MKKIIKGISIFTLVVLSLTLVYSVNAYAITEDKEYDLSLLAPSKNSKYNSYDYVIDKYDINIVVNENNTFDIKETITAYFNVSKHGIFRTIPLKNTVERLDGTVSKNRTQVTNVKVNKEYTTSKENGYYKIKIGSADYTVRGSQEYVIEYTYNLGKDPSKNYDEIYYNIIGTEWDAPIGNVTFSITMPKGFDSSKLGFSSGAKGSIANDKIKYNVTGNQITGSYEDILDVGEALTIRCELPEGYFVGAKLKADPLLSAMIIIPVIFLGIAIIIWYIFGREYPVVETVEFYPPEGLNSLDVALLYNGKIKSKDVTSLLIYLANKGYLEIIEKDKDINFKKVNLKQDAKNSSNEKIIELENKIAEERAKDPTSKKIKYYENMLNIYKNIDTPVDYEQYGVEAPTKKKKKQGFIIRKLRNYVDGNPMEKCFLDELFSYGRGEVEDTMLYDGFYLTTKRIVATTNGVHNKEKIFEDFQENSKRKNFIYRMILITFLVITVLLLISGANQIDSDRMEMLIMLMIFAPIFFGAAFSFPHVEVSEIIKMVAFFLIFALFLMMPIILQVTQYVIAYIIGLICMAGMAWCALHISRRSQYGREMLGKMRGFKKFLEVAKKEELEALVEKNPNYFYDILPYTYVLGVSNKWIKKFEGITMAPPSWYGDNLNSFDYSSFGGFINHTMSYSQNAMTSHPYSSGGGSSGGGSSGGSSSGGGSSGGGSSGGGSGGGRRRLLVE